MSIATAQQAITAAARYHQLIANQCSAVSYLVDALKPNEETFPAESLAKALQPLDLCLVHRNLLRQCLAIIEQTEDTEGFSGDELRRLMRGLNSALKGGAA